MAIFGYVSHYQRVTSTHGDQQAPRGHPVYHSKSVGCNVLTLAMIRIHHIFLQSNSLVIYIDGLVGGAITILKNMKVNGKDYPICYGKNMFETTKQWLNPTKIY